MARIADFKSQLINGGFRPNQFRCEILFPSTVPNNDAGRAVQFLAKSASLPSSTISSIPVSYRGRPAKFAGEREFQPWTIEVYSDTDFAIRNAFEAWIDTMQRAGSTAGAIDPLSYQSTLKAIAMDRNDNEVKTYVFNDAYPTEIGQIQLDWESNNQIATFAVTFDYNWFDAIGGEAA